MAGKCQQWTLVAPIKAADNCLLKCVAKRNRANSKSHFKFLLYFQYPQISDLANAALVRNLSRDTITPSKSYNLTISSAKSMKLRKYKLLNKLSIKLHLLKICKKLEVISFLLSAWNLALLIL